VNRKNGNLPTLHIYQREAEPCDVFDAGGMHMTTPIAMARPVEIVSGLFCCLQNFLIKTPFLINFVSISGAFAGPGSRVQIIYRFLYTLSELVLDVIP